jgi:hypothetical protein
VALFGIDSAIAAQLVVARREELALLEERADRGLREGVPRWAQLHADLEDAGDGD